MNKLDKLFLDIVRFRKEYDYFIKPTKLNCIKRFINRKKYNKDKDRLRLKILSTISDYVSADIINLDTHIHKYIEIVNFINNYSIYKHMRENLPYYIDNIMYGSNNSSTLLFKNYMRYNIIEYKNLAKNVAIRMHIRKEDDLKYDIDIDINIRKLDKGTFILDDVNINSIMDTGKENLVKIEKIDKYMGLILSDLFFYILKDMNIFINEDQIYNIINK